MPSHLNFLAMQVSLHGILSAVHAASATTTTSNNLIGAPYACAFVLSLLAQGLKNGFFVSSWTTAVGSRTSANGRMDKIMDTLFVI